MFLAERAEINADKEEEKEIEEINDPNRPVFDPTDFYSKEIVAVTLDYIRAARRAATAARPRSDRAIGSTLTGRTAFTMPLGSVNDAPWAVLTVPAWAAFSARDKSRQTPPSRGRFALAARSPCGAWQRRTRRLSHHVSGTRSPS